MKIQSATKGSVRDGKGKGHGQSSAGEERTMDDAGVHPGRTIQSVNADEGLLTGTYTILRGVAGLALKRRRA